MIGGYIFLELFYKDFYIFYKDCSLGSVETV